MALLFCFGFVSKRLTFLLLCKVFSYIKPILDLLCVHMNLDKFIEKLRKHLSMTRMQ